jgi:hypothetical protein
MPLTEENAWNASACALAGDGNGCVAPLRPQLLPVVYFLYLLELLGAAADALTINTPRPHTEK